MAKIDFDLDDLTNAALRRMVKKLLIASDSEEKEILSSLDKKSKAPHKNDLADLDEQMHGKPNTPMVEDDDLPGDGELADLPKKGKK
jgi:hypothetical protein